MNDNAGSYASLRSAPRQRLADIVPLPAPFTIYLELTNICNFKCSFCPMHFEDYSEIAGGSFTLGDAEIEKIFTDIKQLGRLKTLNLYMMGEPFVNRKLTDYIALAKRMDIAERIIVTTNGTLITPAVAEKIVASGLDYIRFSIYGTTQDELAVTAGTKVPLERIVSNIRTLKSIRDSHGSQTPHVYIKTIDSGDAARNARFRTLFQDVGDETAIEPAMNWNDSVDEINLSGLGEQVLNTPYLSHKKEVCPFPFYTLVINADLQVTVCCTDWRKETVVGNLKAQSLEEIWRGEAMRNFRLTHLERRRLEIPACTKCTYLYTTPDNIDELSAAEFLRRG